MRLLSCGGIRSCGGLPAWRGGGPLPPLLQSLGPRLAPPPPPPPAPAPGPPPLGQGPISPALPAHSGPLCPIPTLPPAGAGGGCPLCRCFLPSSSWLSLNFGTSPGWRGCGSTLKYSCFRASIALMRFAGSSFRNSDNKATPALPSLRACVLVIDGWIRAREEIPVVLAFQSPLEMQLPDRIEKRKPFCAGHCLWCGGSTQPEDLGHLIQVSIALQNRLPLVHFGKDTSMCARSARMDFTAFFQTRTLYPTDRLRMCTASRLTGALEACTSG